MKFVDSKQRSQSPINAHRIWHKENEATMVIMNGISAVFARVLFERTGFSFIKQ